MDAIYYQRDDGQIFRLLSACIFVDDNILLMRLLGPMAVVSRAGELCLEPETDEDHFEHLTTMAGAYTEVDVSLSTDGTIVASNHRAFEPGDWL